MPATITKEKTETKLAKQAMTDAEEERQVIVHCSIKSDGLGTLIRIWRSTFLVCAHTAHKSPLVHCENISLFPKWTEVPPFTLFQFTLIFKALPKGVSLFHLIETIPEEGGFEAKNIKRNKQDVYYVAF